MKVKYLTLILVLLIILSGCKKKEVAPPSTPVINSFSPQSGFAGERVTIRGDNFGSSADAVTVQFGSSVAIKPIGVTQVEISLDVPTDATTGPIKITVNGRTATSSSNFTVHDPTTPRHTITEFSPTTAKAGATVTITGTGFGTDKNTVNIKFGSSASVHPQTISPTKMTVIVPTDVTSGKLQVSVSGSSYLNSFQDFTLKPVLLAVTDFSPKKIPYDDTLKLTGIFGSDAGQVEVYFTARAGELFKTKPIKATATELLVIVPAEARTGRLRVVNNNISDFSDRFFDTKDTLTVMSKLYFSDYRLPKEARINTTVRLNAMPTTATTTVKDINVSFGGSVPINPVFITSSDVYVRVPADAKSGKITVTMAGYKNSYTNPFVMQIKPVEKFGPWLRMDDFTGTSRGNAMVFVIGSKVYVCGGKGEYALGTDYYNDLWVYDTSLKIWQQKAEFKGGMRYGGVAFTIGNIGYVGTGFDQNGNPKNDLWAYDPSTDVWTQKANFQGESRGLAVGFAANGKGFIGSGVNAAKKSLDDFYRYDPASNSWTQTASIPGARNDAFVTTIDNKAYVGNGLGSSTFQMYDPALNTWTAKAAVPSSFDAGGSIAYSINGKAHVTFTRARQLPIVKKVYEFNPATNSWGTLPDTDDIFINGIAFVLDGVGYLGLGTGYSGSAPHKNIWSYNP